MKRIIRLTESDLARIVRRVMNEAATGMDTTTLISGGDVTIPSKSVCGGIDYFQANFKVNNKGPKGAFITAVTLGGKDKLPGLMNASELGIRINNDSGEKDFGVMVNGKPSAAVNPDTKTKQPFIPVGQTGVITVNLYVQGWNYVKNQASDKNYTEKQFYADMLKPRKANLVVNYNGMAPLTVPVNYGGFSVNPALGCTAAKAIAKGF
jgi:hypothetical protein